MVESANLLFSHREAVLLTNVSDEALHSWVRRGYVAPAVASTGRGKRRAYDQMNLVEIYVMQAFSQGGIDPSLSGPVIEKLKPLARDLIARHPVSHVVPSFSSAGDEHAPFDRVYRTWLVDRYGRVCAEFTRGADGVLVPNRDPKLLPLTAMWIAVDVMLNEWVFVPVEYVQAGRPQPSEDYDTWIDHRVTEARKQD